MVDFSGATRGTKCNLRRREETRTSVTRALYLDVSGCLRPKEERKTRAKGQEKKKRALNSNEIRNLLLLVRHLFLIASCYY